MVACFARCLILRVNGELSLLDLDEGRERELTDSVELFWVTCGPSEEKINLIEEVSWLDYGHRGMQVMNCRALYWFLIHFISYHLIYYDLSLVLVICTCLIQILVGSLFLQVWYPSPGVEPFMQEDFMQVCMFSGLFILQFFGRQYLTGHVIFLWFVCSQWCNFLRYIG